MRSAILSCQRGGGEREPQGSRKPRRSAVPRRNGIPDRHPALLSIGPLGRGVSNYAKFLQLSCSLQLPAALTSSILCLRLIRKVGEYGDICAYVGIVRDVHTHMYLGRARTP